MTRKNLTLALMVPLLTLGLTACVAPPRPTVEAVEPLPMELVRIPAGEFLMGSDPVREPFAKQNQQPEHRVELAEYYIGKYEVTNTQYAAFVTDTGHDAPEHWRFGSPPAGAENHPVVGISWYDALAFIDWLTAYTGTVFRLCTEAEWEKACRGTDGHIYPWGDAWDATKANARSQGIPATTAVKFVMTPVGSFSPAGDSPHGVADMAGNTWEWTSSLMDSSYPYDPADGREDLAREGDRTIRGGAYINQEGAACTERGNGFTKLRLDNYGLRVCATSNE